jgi:hypothetical protein
MKPKFITLILILFSWATMSSQVIINHQDIPLPHDPLTLYSQLNITPPNPSRGQNQTWTYSSGLNLTENLVTYYAETEPQLTALGIDFYRLRFKQFNSNFGYDYFEEIDFDTSGIYDVATWIEPQPYTLAPFTGNNKDSLIIPFQVALCSGSRKMMQFPTQFDKHWTSRSRRVVDLNLDIAAYNLKKTPAKHIWTIVRTDSIVGYGKLSTATPNGPTVAVDVLMDKVTQYSIDSFLLNGAPAPTALLNAFSIKQGQISNIENRINFYRKGGFPYFMTLYYGASSHTLAEEIHINAQDVALSTSSVDNEVNIHTLVYPNPSSTGIFNIKLIGQSLPNQVHTHVYAVDGRLLQSQSYTPTTEMQIDLSNYPKKSLYKIIVTNREGKMLFDELVSTF